MQLQPWKKNKKGFGLNNIPVRRRICIYLLQFCTYLGNFTGIDNYTNPEIYLPKRTYWKLLVCFLGVLFGWLFFVLELNLLLQILLNYFYLQHLQMQGQRALLGLCHPEQPHHGCTSLSYITGGTVLNLALATLMHWTAFVDGYHSWLLTSLFWECGRPHPCQTDSGIDLGCPSLNCTGGSCLAPGLCPCGAASF